MPKGDDYKTNPSRFWEKVDKSDPDGCWLWIGRRTRQGYGVVDLWFSHTERYQMAAHRFAWQQEISPIPDDVLVLHHCDNPPCVRPDHLFLGSQKDNLWDANDKSRLGGRTGKLTDTERYEIVARFNAGESSDELAREFGVHRNYPSTLRQRLTKYGRFSHRQRGG